jgi:hypothetical protein
VAVATRRVIQAPAVTYSSFAMVPAAM